MAGKGKSVNVKDDVIAVKDSETGVQRAALPPSQQTSRVASGKVNISLQLYKKKLSTIYNELKNIFFPKNIKQFIICETKSLNINLDNGLIY